MTVTEQLQEAIRIAEEAKANRGATISSNDDVQVNSTISLEVKSGSGLN